MIETVNILFIWNCQILEHSSPLQLTKIRSSGMAWKFNTVLCQTVLIDNHYFTYLVTTKLSFRRRFKCYGCHVYVQSPTCKKNWMPRYSILKPITYTRFDEKEQFDAVLCCFVRKRLFSLVSSTDKKAFQSKREKYVVQNWVICTEFLVRRSIYYKSFRIEWKREGWKQSK